MKESPKLKTLNVLNRYCELNESKAFLKSKVVINPGILKLTDDLLQLA